MEYQGVLVRHDDADANRVSEAVETEGSFFGWILAGIAGIVSALSTAVAALYKAQIADLKLQLVDAKDREKVNNEVHKEDRIKLEQIEAELRKEIADCKTDREDLRVCLAKIQVEQEIMRLRLDAVEAGQ